jgi:ABC-2 type transport system ATP-binding protein
MSSKHVLIKLEHLKVCYADTMALKVDQLSAKGNAIALVGHNGSGKSTMIKTVLGLLQPKAGSLNVYSADNLSKRLVPEQHMAFAPENGAVFADITVENYLKLWCRIKAGNASYYKRAGSRYVERLELTELLPKLGRELSKGQRRRVQIAVGFLSNPELFLFDEPFDGLDVHQSNQLLQLMLEETENMSIIVSSHRMEMVERVSDQVIVLENGGIVTHGSIDQVCEALCSRSLLLSSWATQRSSRHRPRSSPPATGLFSAAHRVVRINRWQQSRSSGSKEVFAGQAA